jgi:hypothetical protein
MRNTFNLKSSKLHFTVFSILTVFFVFSSSSVFATEIHGWRFLRFGMSVDQAEKLCNRNNFKKQKSSTDECTLIRIEGIDTFVEAAFEDNKLHAVILSNIKGLSQVLDGNKIEKKGFMGYGYLGGDIDDEVLKYVNEKMGKKYWKAYSISDEQREILNKTNSPTIFVLTEAYAEDESTPPKIALGKVSIRSPRANMRVKGFFIIYDQSETAINEFIKNSIRAIDRLKQELEEF